MTELSIEDRNGVIVICVHGEALGQVLSIPLFAFADMDALKRFTGMLSKFIDGKSTPVPKYLKDAFKED